MPTEKETEKTIAETQRDLFNQIVNSMKENYDDIYFTSEILTELKSQVDEALSPQAMTRPEHEYLMLAEISAKISKWLSLEQAGLSMEMFGIRTSKKKAA
jgi:hypothetical protein